MTTDPNPSPELLEIEMTADGHKQVVPVYIRDQAATTKSVIDSMLVRWSKSLITLIFIPITLACVYGVWNKLDFHDHSLTVISDTEVAMKDTLQDIKDSQKELKETVVSLAQNQVKDERDIAGLQQSDIDRHSIPEPTPAPEPPAPVQKLQHHSSRAHQPDIFAAIEKAFTPAHGLRARASVPERGK